IGVEASLEPAQAVEMAELGIDQSHQMIPALERLVVSVSIEPLHDRLKLPSIDRLEKMPEDAIPEAHARPFCVSTTRKGRCESVRPSMHRDIVNRIPRTALRAAAKVPSAARARRAFARQRAPKSF